MKKREKIRKERGSWVREGKRKLFSVKMGQGSMWIVDVEIKTKKKVKEEIARKQRKHWKGGKKAEKQKGKKEEEKKRRRSLK